MAAESRPAADTLAWTVAGDAGRLDLHVASNVAALSRSQVQKMILAGEVLVNGREASPSLVLRTGDAITVHLPQRGLGEVLPEAIDIAVVYESADVVVVDKPAGMLVHPTSAASSGTLVNAMLARYPEIADVGPAGRQGVVHRLDKDTSGLVAFGRTTRGLRYVQEQFAHHDVWKTYLALLVGSLQPVKGVVDAPLGRHPRDRKRQAVVRQGGRPARTQYETVRTYRGYCLVTAHPLTGRTHQIRVHFAALSHPVAGDPLYGRGSRDLGLKRQFLHAHRLRFLDPRREEAIEVESPLPNDLQAVLDVLAGEG